MSWVAREAAIQAEGESFGRLQQNVEPELRQGRSSKGRNAATPYRV